MIQLRLATQFLTTQRDFNDYASPPQHARQRQQTERRLGAGNCRSTPLLGSASLLSTPPAISTNSKMPRQQCSILAYLTLYCQSLPTARLSGNSRDFQNPILAFPACFCADLLTPVKLSVNSRDFQSPSLAFPLRGTFLALLRTGFLKISQIPLTRNPSYTVFQDFPKLPPCQTHQYSHFPRAIPDGYTKTPCHGTCLSVTAHCLRVRVQTLNTETPTTPDRATRDTNENHRIETHANRRKLLLDPFHTQSCVSKLQQ